MSKITKEDRLRISYNFHCKKASKCRHEIHQVSCFSCSYEPTCEIQAKVKSVKQSLDKLK